ncbi:PKD domain-containing protein [Aggregatimonas sangjinii]|uniref:PKD domain-containing protein n=1 Tax=Aggregatimonas sangjinii TaxID=2583587 RepID=A0A5B7SPB4_9FLAO|nr:ThuA domain-containing protein [Aggregatimonas sangjinii]QCX00406.1 PKD domain-containing protein [Aggregatimonas sangjinii]
MKKAVLFFLVLSGLIFTSCDNKREGAPKVLVFSKTMGFEHASIPAGIAAIQKLGSENGFEVDTTKNADLFEEENLKRYSAIIFLSTTMNVLDHKQEAAFERYIQAGGGFVGVHAATDTEYDWGWYNKLVGAQFLSHPQGTPEADFIIKDNDFIATKHFTDSIWHRFDELYNYKNINPDVNVIMTVDESTYEGGKNGDFHPIAWYHEFDGGRAFYTGAGHTDESYEEEAFVKHLLAGIQYAIGENNKLDYGKAVSQIPPDIDRFSKNVLIEGEFFEPTEMTILPDGDVLVAQRRGEVMLYSASTKEVTEVLKLNVYDKTLNTPGVNAEEGLMGIQKDPNFAENNWVYLYYAPTGDEQINRLSRMKFKNDAFDTASEQVILDVFSQREICCHTGGSIAFDKDGLLYVSTGDNSTPFDEKDAEFVNNGYAPLNDIPGKEQYDARRSSGNTNDLRGKILRIKVNEDGSYDIPEGNLFPVGNEKTRPEIYTMGHRNPYRISVDQKRGYVYWGDVGPDARVDQLNERGPKGYDEMNQARAAGNFGWPLFIGDNKPYVDYDYTNGESGKTFDPEKPINDSKNNTGLTELPPAQPAYMFYPYGASQEFPQAGSGGRNAMAGPTYYSDMYDDGGGLPSYYDGKVIIYDWMRGWMMAVSLFKDGSVNKMEPFASDIKVNNLIDMEMGPDGKLYLLEYGSGWFSKNDNAALSIVDFNGGNRPPIIDYMSVDQNSGKLPLTITASVSAMDREKDAVTYLWDLGNGEVKETSVPEISYTYTDAGLYKIAVEVKDAAGESATSESTTIVAGNTRPEVAISIINGNSSFYVPGQPVNYEVSVTDAEGGDIDASKIFVSVDYMDGMDKVNMNLGHQQVSATVTGKALTMAMDCKTCHKEAEASIGPNYMDIAKKYREDKNAIPYLQKKIKEGGSGVWGEVMMAAHPDISSDETRQIAAYIMSLNGDLGLKPSLPPKGAVRPEATKPGNLMVLTASYTDEGAEGAIPLTGNKSVVLASNTVGFSKDTKTDGMTAVTFGGRDLLLLSGAKGWFELNDIDLTGVSNIVLGAGWQEAPKATYNFDIRLNSPDGEVIGQGTLAPQPAGTQGAAIVMPLTTETTGKNILYITGAIEAGKTPSNVALLNATFN